MLFYNKFVLEAVLQHFFQGAVLQEDCMIMKGLTVKTEAFAGFLAALARREPRLKAASTSGRDRPIETLVVKVLKSSVNTDGKYANLDLAVCDGFMGLPGADHIAPASRENVDAVFDLLGLFPRAEWPLQRRADLVADISEIRKLAHLITETDDLIYKDPDLGDAGFEESFAVSKAHEILCACARLEKLFAGS